MIRTSYEAYRKRKCLALVLGAFLILIVGFCSTTVGVMNTSPLDVPRAIWSWINGNLEGNAAFKVIVLMRLPRTILCILSGCGLAVAGAAMQGITSNPLVSPFTAGISNAAAFGASLMILFGGALCTDVGIIVGAFAMSLLCTSIVYFISRSVGMKPETLILVGTAFSYLFSASTSVLEIFADEHQLSEVVRWSFGTVNGATWDQNFVIFIFVIVCSFLLLMVSPKLNIMMMGDDSLSMSMGVNTSALRTIVLLISVLMTAAIISFTGVIGFVGLIAPHIGRSIIGEDNRYLLPFSAMIGALLMLVSDIAGRVVIAPAVLPVGIVISFLGVPMFLSLIWKRGKS